jgi:two-component system response regulator YesN
MQPDILKIIATIQKMAQYIIQSFETSGKKSRREVLTVQKYIKEHYSADLSLETLSSLVYLTPDYLSRLFKKDTGKSLSQYTRQVRMEKAIELLYTTNKKVVDISAEVGYPNYSYFCQSFREYFGKSPERYRQEECHEAFV